MPVVTSKVSTTSKPAEVKKRGRGRPRKVDTVETTQKVKKTTAKKAPKIDKDNPPELSEVLKAANTRYGGMTVRSGSNIIQPTRVSTGSFVLDFCLLGGLPNTRANMYLGEPHAGKSSLSYMYIANMQKQFPDQVVTLLDVEGTFDATWASKLGVDLDALEVADVETGEMAIDLGIAVIQSKETSLLVVDSIAAMEPTKEVENSIEDQNVALQARLITSFTRRITHSIIKERKRQHWPAVHLINQFRDKIGGFVRGDPRSYPGGRALKHTTSVEVIIKNSESKGKDNSGNDTMHHNDHSFTIKKNKLSNGPRAGEFQMVRVDDPKNNLYAGNIDDSHTVLAYAKKFGLWSGAGANQRLSCSAGNWKFRTAAEAETMLRGDREIYWSLRTEIIQMQAASQGMSEEFIARIGDQPIG